MDLLSLRYFREVARREHVSRAAGELRVAQPSVSRTIARLEVPLAVRERVTVAEIADEPFITTRPGNWQRALLERLFTGIGRRPVISCEGDEPGATHFLIAAGLGIGLIPALARPELPHVPLAWLHLDTPDCVRTLDLVRREDSHLTTAARRFRAMAVAHFAARERPDRPGAETGAG
ncbi:LysR family transcriptional regulator [Streptomyces angustmyceticus]|uniref:LysR family transcriptional regulator n=1 Tax=Streptomyces angustmyceticus TaxID=285578 RepID=UPI003D8FF6B7